MNKTDLPFGNRRGRRVPREGARLRAVRPSTKRPASQAEATRAPVLPPDALTRDRLERGLEAWLIQCQARRVSPATLTNRRFLVKKLLWFLDHRALHVCDREALSAFLAHAGTPPEPGEVRWGNATHQPQARRETRPETVATYHRILRTAFRWMVAEEYLAVSPIEKVGSSRVDLQACKLEYSIVSPK